MIILALDIMDDLQDQDNQVKVWMSWTQSAAMNVYLSLLMGAIAELERSGQELEYTNLVGEVSALILRAVQGQHMDTEHQINSESEYVTSVIQKSGSLIGLACYMGYASAGMNDPETRFKLEQLADCIGMMAQLENDLRDILRYDIKNDLLQKKKTLPILYLLEHSEKDFPLLKQYYEGNCSKEVFLKSKIECLNYIEASGCVEYTKVIQALYYQKADELLSSIDAVEEWKEKFKEIGFAAYGVEAIN
jgi:competence protein ComQ